jgi:hypothetical protein
MKELDSSQPRAAAGSATPDGAGAEDLENRDRKRPSARAEAREGAKLAGSTRHDPTVEADYWRANYAQRPYAAGRTYDELEPAYRYGWESRGSHPARRWAEAESDLRTGWVGARGDSRLGWNEARGAVEDAWTRVDMLLISRSFDPEEDRYWRQTYASRPYALGRTYDDLRPAYQYGCEAAAAHPDRDWNEAQGDLEKGWSRTTGGRAGMRWHEVKDAVRDAWERLRAKLSREPAHASSHR